MVHRIVVFILIFSFIKAIRSQINSPCVTPNGEDATCVSYFSCSVITTALASNAPGAMEFAEQSNCGNHNGIPLVCCGSTGHLINSDILADIFNLDVSTISPIEQSVILSDFNTKSLPNRTVCGLEREVDKVLGGEIAKIYEFPWMVSLEFSSKISKNRTWEIRCGGTLINNRYVLTAAHCLISSEFQLERVWVGDWRISSDPDCLNQTVNEVCNDPVLKVKVDKQIPHAFYDNGNNDIALIKLERDVTFTDYIRPICLPPANLPTPTVGSRLTVAGWGVTTEGGLGADFKMKVEVPLTTNTECRRLSQNRFISANQLCAGGEFGKDSCQGDSGGPLMRRYEDGGSKQIQWYLEGVVAYGSGCGRAGTPAVYTSVSRYLNWVINHIAEDN